MSIQPTKLQHTLLIGPPSTGKTRWAKRLYEAHKSNIEARVSDYTYRCAGLQDRSTTRGFRAPHHTASPQAVLGALVNHMWRPGEVSLAAGGILLLDELPEFGRSVIEGLREPMTTGVVTLANSRNTLRVPADFTLVAAANPCPCGWHGHAKRACTCSPKAIERYMARISGWLWDQCSMLGPDEYAS